jgi:hypothetical protein
MFRTRDFILLFSAAVFLVVGIGVTALAEYQAGRSHSAAVLFAEVSEQEFTAELQSTEPPSREARLSEMRDKIAAQGEVAVDMPEMIAAVVESESTAGAEEVTEEPESVASLMKCPGYAAYQGSWSPQGVQFAVAEGARVVTRTVVGGAPEAAEVLLQLPLYPFAGTPSCLRTDVVGIAQDGSLIKNNEVGLYGVFGEHTLIGYALDGFPLYGTTNLATDACGGAVVAGEDNLMHYSVGDRWVGLAPVLSTLIDAGNAETDYTGGARIDLGSAQT